MDTARVAGNSGGKLRTFEGAVALITGGASGIGAALARQLVSRGTVVVLADRQEELAQEVAATVRSTGGQAEVALLDVRDAAAFEQLVADIFARHGRLDYLFNNAGTGVAGEAVENTLDDWRYIVEVNLMGVVHGVHAAYRRMVEQGFGHIVNTASMAGLMPTPGSVSYGATKHGVVGLSRSLRTEAQCYGVRVSVLCPGVIRTPILANGGRFGRTTRPVNQQAQLAFMESLQPMDADVFAGRALRQVAMNREIIVIPGVWKLIWWVNRVCPSLGAALSKRGYLQVRAALFPPGTQDAEPTRRSRE
jgi:NAD(P)-dependent dehydrogenase (short-subunit alcohol dehydrogenase family)